MAALLIACKTPSSRGLPGIVTKRRFRKVDKARIIAVRSAKTVPSMLLQGKTQYRGEMFLFKSTKTGLGWVL
jgi:hypothetical protein